MSRLSEKLKNLIGKVAPYAPAVATALGGPGAGAAIAVLSKTLLGHDKGSEDDVALAMSTATPEQLAALRKADQDYDLALYESDERDRKDARANNTANGDLWTIRVLGGVVVVGFFASVGYVLSGKVGLSGEQGVLVGSVLGYASAKADQVISYFFGSSHGSKLKTEALSRAAAK